MNKIYFGYGSHHSQHIHVSPDRPATRQWSGYMRRPFDAEELIDLFLRGPQGPKQILEFDQYDGHLPETWACDKPSDRISNRFLNLTILWNWLNEKHEVVGQLLIYTVFEYINFYVAADNLTTCDQIAESANLWYLENLEPKAPDDMPEDIVNVAFWNLSPDGARRNNQDLKCPSLEEVAGNYPDCVCDGLRWTAEHENPLETGKLIFWMGLPGTGKTWSVRALMREWKGKAQFHVITDPEVFFNHVDYLQTVMQNGSSEKINLIIIEDSPRVVLQEARGTHETHAMSRLLNLTDGLWGEAKKTIFLMTTNDNIKDIDRAFLRDGRLLQRLSFRGFNHNEAVKWLEDHGVEEIPYHELESEEEIPLCKLYGIMRKAGSSRIKTEQKGPMGFQCSAVLEATTEKTESVA